MLELVAAGRLRAVVPIFIGEPTFDGTTVAISDKDCNGGGGLMGSLFKSQAYQRISTAVHTLVNEQARRLLEEMDIRPSALLQSRTIKDVVHEISKNMGIEAHKYFEGAGVGPRRWRGDRRLHQWEVGMRQLVQAVCKKLMIMLDSDEMQRAYEAREMETRKLRMTEVFGESEDDSHLTHQVAEMEQLLAEGEMKQLGALAVEAQVAIAAAYSEEALSVEIMRLKAQMVEMERFNASAALGNAAACQAAEMERLRAVVEMERLRAQVAVAQADAAEAKAIFSAETDKMIAQAARIRAQADSETRAAVWQQQSGCCGVS